MAGRGERVRGELMEVKEGVVKNGEMEITEERVFLDSHTSHRRKSGHCTQTETEVTKACFTCVCVRAANCART